MPAFFVIWTMEVSDGADDGRKIATENAVPDFIRGNTSCSLKKLALQDRCTTFILPFFLNIASLRLSALLGKY